MTAAPPRGLDPPPCRTPPKKIYGTPFSCLPFCLGPGWGAPNKNGRARRRLLGRALIGFFGVWRPPQIPPSPPRGRRGHIWKRRAFTIPMFGISNILAFALRRCEYFFVGPTKINNLKIWNFPHIGVAPGVNIRARGGARRVYTGKVCVCRWVWGWKYSTSTWVLRLSLPFFSATTKLPKVKNKWVEILRYIIYVYPT